MRQRRGFSRRTLIAAGGVALLPRVAIAGAAESEIAAIEARTGGRIGVAALDTKNDTRIAYRADERFAMCSTFKWLLAAAVLAEVDRNRLALDHLISYGKNDLLPHAPVTSAHVGDGALPIATLCEAAVEDSDNTAANLLLARVGGPAGLTQFLRSHRDQITRLDRTELALNSNLPGDPRDTSTPAAQLATMRRVLLGHILSTESREHLIGWMKDCHTGRHRLRAGIPEGWIVGDKTGTGENGAVNDLAIAWPPHRAAILIVAYCSGSKLPTETLETAHADIARIVAAAFANR